MQAEQHPSYRSLFLVKKCLLPLLHLFFKIRNQLVLRSPHDHKVCFHTTVNDTATHVVVTEKYDQ